MLQGEEVIVYIELHELKWVLALMCWETNWETETALVKGAGSMEIQTGQIQFK